MSYTWEIAKEFQFEAGHRVWSQTLNRPDLSISTDCACKHLHGHSYTIKVWLGADRLDSTQMVTDFKNLNFIKTFLDENLDHKFIVDVNDPNFNIITAITLNKDIPFSKKYRFWNLLDYIKEVDNYLAAETSTNIKSHVSGFVVVDFVPTSENLAKYLFKHFQKVLGSFATVIAVELFETKKSSCRYTGD